jgi:hypothetical protein
MRTRVAPAHALPLVVSLILLAACNGTGSASVSGGAGRLEVQLTDAPLDLSGVSSVVVSLTNVLVYPGVQGMNDDMAVPIVLTTHPQTFDLLTLTGGATALLASGEVPAGFYQRIRLEVSAATLTYKDGTMVDLKIESGKVDVPIRFEVKVGGDATVVLDFDAAASIQVNATATDSLILRPVVTPKPM